MKKLETLITLVLVCGGAVLLYQKLDSMGPESEPQSATPAQTETAAAETKPVVVETPAQPSPAAPAPAPVETPAAKPAEAASTTPATSAPPPSVPAAPAAAVMPEQPAASAASNPPAATTSPAAATPEKPATKVAEQPSAPPAPVQPATPTPTVVPPPQPTVPPAPAATTPMPQPTAPAPVQVAKATPPPAPAPAAPVEPQKKLTELTQDDLLARLPVNARTGYRTARAAAESKGEMIGLRSWFVQWRRYLVDPMRALLELDMANLLLQNKATYPNESTAKQAKRGNANEARMLITGILYRRINNPELSEMVAKVKQDADRELEQLK